MECGRTLCRKPRKDEGRVTTSASIIHLGQASGHTPSACGGVVDMLKVYIDKILDGVQHVPILIPNFGPLKFSNELFRASGFNNFSDPFVVIVETVGECDFILLPHNYSQVKNRKDFLEFYETLSVRYEKPIIVFAYGDTDEKIDIPNSLVLKYSMYGHSRQSNEIKIPAYVEDLLQDKKNIFRSKGGLPVVSFCGWAEYGNKCDAVKASFRNGFINAKRVIVGDSYLECYKQGIYFRKKFIDILRQSNFIKTDFIVRKSHSANKKTIELSADMARTEYINNIVNSDFSLAIRGDANESMRLYEILSLGRIPILIDTDCVLPREDILQYDKFILRIDFRDFRDADKIIYNFYNSLSNEGFTVMQKMARDAFEKYLRPEAFFRRLFSDLTYLKKCLKPMI